VGRGVSDLLLGSGTPFYAVTITSGGTPRPYASKGSRVSWNVPKTTLVEALERPFRLGNLKMANGLRWGPVLVEELRNFRRKVSQPEDGARQLRACASERPRRPNSGDGPGMLGRGLGGRRVGCPGRDLALGGSLLGAAGRVGVC
jgi:hypothetical protein